MLAGEPQLFDSQIVGDGGAIRYTQVSYTPDRVDGAVRGFFVLVTDITARREAERSVEAAEARFRTLFEFAPIGTFLVDDQGHVLDANLAGVEMMGVPRDALLGTRVSELTHPDDRDATREQLNRLMAGEIDSYCLEKRYLLPDGQSIWAQTNVMALRGDPDRPAVAVAQIQDISERRAHEAQLRDLADRDSMSGLLNHRSFMAHVERQALTAARHGTGGVLLLLDLDGFKTVNDTHGHQAGDQLIVAVAELLRGRVRQSDVVGRLGGDEFGIITPFGRQSEGRQLAQSLLDVLRARTDPRGTRVGASIGIAEFRDKRSGHEVAAAADAAMYRAKAAGGDQFACDVRAA